MRVHNFTLNRSWILWSFFALMLGTPMLAWSYIVPSSFVTKNIVQKHQLQKPILIKSIVTQGILRVRKRAIYYPQTQMYRFWVLDDFGVPGFGAQVPSLKTNIILTLLYGQRVETLDSLLKSIGVPIKTEDELKSLATEEERRNAEQSYFDRLNGNPAWVFGTSSGAQLWVEKDGFVPIQLVLDRSIGGASRVQFYSYKEFNKFMYPQKIVYADRSGQTLASEEIEDVNFDYGREVGEKVSSLNGFTSTANFSDPVKDLLKTHYELFR